MAAAGVLVAVMLADLLLVSTPIFREAFPIRPIAVRSNTDFRQILSLPGYDARGWRREDSNPLYSTLSGVYPAFLSHRGSTRGYEVVPVPSRAAFARRADYRGEVYLDGTGGYVAFERWSPNRLVLDVRAEGVGTVIVNQNHAPGWRVVRYGADGPVEGQVFELGGLLAVPVDPSDSKLELAYRPASFLIGAAVTATAVVVLVGTALWGWRRRGGGS